MNFSAVGMLSTNDLISDFCLAVRVVAFAAKVVSVSWVTGAALIGSAGIIGFEISSSVANMVQTKRIVSPAVNLY